jgi:hypothetical protein
LRCVLADPSVSSSMSFEDMRRQFLAERESMGRATEPASAVPDLLLASAPLDEEADGLQEEGVHARVSAPVTKVVSPAPLAPVSLPKKPVLAGFFTSDSSSVADAASRAFSTGLGGLPSFSGKSVDWSARSNVDWSVPASTERSIPLVAPPVEPPQPSVKPVQPPPAVVPVSQPPAPAPSGGFDLSALARQVQASSARPPAPASSEPPAKTQAILQMLFDSARKTGTSVSAGPPPPLPSGLSSLIAGFGPSPSAPRPDATLFHAPQYAPMPTAWAPAPPLSFGAAPSGLHAWPGPPSSQARRLHDFPTRP